MHHTLTSAPRHLLLCALCASASAAPHATFLSDGIEYRLGESVMVPLRLDAPAAETVHGVITAERDGVVEVLRQPEFLAGHEIGFARIHTLTPGDVVLRHGESCLHVSISAERPVALMRQMRPQFTSPSGGANVWGTVAVGAEIWVGAPGVDRERQPEAKLHLPDGRELAADEAFPPVDGPFWRLVFQLDTSTLPPGECVIFVSAKPPIEGAGDGKVRMSEPHTLQILPAALETDIVFTGECENALDTPRTERMGNEPPGVVMEPGASGFRAVALRRRRPAWVIQPEITEAGQYQLMLRARGTLAGAAYPSLGVVLGENATDSVSVRLASSNWHNVPVGRPMRLDAGPQWIGVTLANEFNYRNQIQRVAEIDRYELRRVPEGTVGGDAGMMMAGGMMMTEEEPAGEKAKKRADRLRVAFITLVDGGEIRGRTAIRTTLRSPSLRNEREYREIRSDLWINGVRAASEYGQDPVFTVHPHDFKPGENTLQVHSVSPCGNQALSLTQTLHASAPGHPSGKPDTGEFIDAAPPTVELVYPKPGTLISAGGDAMVLHAFDDLALGRFEIHIDGEKAPIAYPAGTGTGQVFLSVPGSLLVPGSRSIEVAAIDESGKETRTQPIRVEVREESGPVLSLPYPRAVRLAKTLGLGIDERTLAAILIQGETAWLDEQLSDEPGDIEHPLIVALGEVWFRDINDYNVRGRVVTQLLATRFPVRARFAQFAQNHFSTWMSKTGASAKWREHQAFRSVGPARFQDLLLTSATSPAMMVYLDQQNSFGRQLNENYAREVMELHTVGVHAGYSQDDVIHLAKLLSGWGAQREATMDGQNIGYEYRYSPYLAEPGPLEIFGLSIPAAGTPDTADDRVRLAIEMLAARPQTARFVSVKMVAHYLGLPVHEPTVAALEAEFLRSGGNLRRMLLMLAGSPQLMAVERPEKIMPPVEFAVATQRASGALHPWSVINLADRSGRNLFDRASPDGFPEGNDEYADSNYQLQKWRFCKELEWQLRGGFPQSAFEPEALADEGHRNGLIDLAFATRHGGPPSAESRAALHKILAQVIADANQRRNLFTSFLHMTPEFQIR